jgi:hypothetical protein
LASFLSPLLLAALIGAVGLPSQAVSTDGDDTRSPSVWNDEDERSWRSERLNEQAGEVLSELARSLEEGEVLAELFTPDFACNDLRPDGAEILRDSRGIRVERVPTARFAGEAVERDPRSALAAFSAPIAMSEAPHVSFKVIGVEERSPVAFEVQVLVQTSARVGAGSVQQDASWSAALRLDEQGSVRIAGLRASRLDEVRFERVPFIDATARALAGAGGSSAVLTAGSERWHGTTDDLGEANYFGHNGIAVGDVNGDDLDDLYVAQGTGLPNLLLVQQPNGTYIERGEASGAAWLDDTKGVLLVDYDDDGDRDLVCCIGPVLVLSTNDGTGTFTPARSLGSESTSSFYSVSAADYDLDGDIDLYAVRYVDTSYGDSIPVPFHDARNGPKNHLMRNDGEAGFVDVTIDVGLDVNNDRFSLASSWSDYDQDGDPDLYVANDFGRNNLYRNDGGTFIDVAAEAGVEDQAAGMGVSWADVDLDGHFDLLVSNMFSSAGRRIAYQPEFQPDGAPGERAAIQRHSLGNSLFCNTAKAGFEEVSDGAGIRMGRWSWGARFADLDGDGLPDVVAPNGFLTGDRDDDL